MSCDGLVSALHRIRPVAAGKDDLKGRPGGREGDLRQLGGLSNRIEWKMNGPSNQS